MGNGYSVAAFDYNKEDIGIDPDTNTKFVPNQKELELFKKEKMNLYKGTWTVCFVYGISAFVLLAIVLFTDTGRMYIYNNYFAAVMTYVIGAIIIIIYLVYSIFNIKPRKLGKVENKLNNCPDYWTFTNEHPEKKEDLIANMTYNNKDPQVIDTINTNPYIMKGTNGQYILNNKDDPIISNDTSNLFIDYKCKIDENIYGNINEQKIMKNRLYADNFNEKYIKKDLNNPKYIVRDLNNFTDTDSEIEKKLKKYALISGIYKPSFSADSNLYSHSIKDKTAINYNSIPLICNEVYPNLLSKLEKDDSTELRCAYADKCKISWSDIDCYKNNVNTTI